MAARVVTPPAPPSLADIFAPHGLLAQHWRGFTERPQQRDMAHTITGVIADQALLICEAGTGTGKTLAYLVPALLARRKVIVSTGTRALQDQLFRHDLPLVCQALGLTVTLALLKGRSNYLCHYRFERTVKRSQRLQPDLKTDLQQVREWALTTTTGDIADCPIAEQAAVWPAVTSTLDNCLGGDCPRLNDCYPLAARRRAQDAAVIVINHHLLCADFALRADNVGEVLPVPACWIVDEAHQLPDIATAFFGSSVSTQQLFELLTDIATPLNTTPATAASAASFQPALLEVRAATHAAQRGFGSVPGRLTWAEVPEPALVLAALQRVRLALAALAVALADVAELHKEWAHGQERCVQLGARLERFITLSAAEELQWVRWCDVQGWGVRLHLTPLDVAPPFEQQRQQHPAAWVFTSATLTVNGSFTHFARQLGLEHIARTARWDSPFDYPRQALWLLPPDMPDPAAAHYTQRVAAITRELVSVTEGRTFVLFTSHRALREVAALLTTPALGYPLLIQGSAPRATLIEQFRADGHAVLLGSTSFWEGVDVRGDALSCVIIDRLPFATPDDPIVRAKIAALQRQGANAFIEYQLPHAVIALKQGAGRLIRDATDHGVLVVCDPRLLSRNYGEAFFRSLPPMTRTQDFNTVRTFIQQHCIAAPPAPTPPVKRRRRRG